MLRLPGAAGALLVRIRVRVRVRVRVRPCGMSIA